MCERSKEAGGVKFESVLGMLCWLIDMGLGLCYWISYLTKVLISVLIE